MSKYDFEIDLSQKTSTGIILSKIKEGSVVLEFGCATGRMTRYMKEALGCEVYIVEYEASAFEKAKVFAKDGLCDDIMTFSWYEKFQGISFDAIIFADVLEHLSAPELVLLKAAELLAEDGCIYTSIPNITHNDVVLKAMDEHFDYTATGILDDTHVHFWGQKNLEASAKKAGLHIRTLEATYCPTGYTEQYGQAGHPVNPLLENALRERTGGEVYQFVLSLEKNKSGETKDCIKKPCLLSHIYLDTGKDFNAEEMIAVKSVYTAKDTYQSRYVLEPAGKIRRFRFDPVELQGCILKNLVIRQGDEVLNYAHSEGVETAEGLLLMGPDPMLRVEIPDSFQPVEIEAEVLLWGEKYIGVLQAHALNMREALEESERKMQENEARHEKQIGGMQLQMQEIQLDLLSYIKVANSKDQYAMALEKELNDYKNLRVVKMYFFVKRILSAIKKRVKRLIGKEENK